MKIILKIMWLVGSLVLLFVCSNISAEQPHGIFKAGYVYTDEVGSFNVYQPTYNLYDGLALSLEKFTYKLENGTRLFGEFKNVTLDNRNIYFGGSKTGLFNSRVSYNQYRRRYDADGSSATKRENYNGTLWIQPHKNVRLFGGYGRLDKSGESLGLLEPTTGFIGATQYDYNQKYFNVGARCSYQGAAVEVEYRGSDFDDNLNSVNQRSTKLYRVVASSPTPIVKNLYVNGGFQRFELQVPEFEDSLISNTGWGGVRYYSKNGFHAKYNFVWDRARRSTDFVSTDNISNAVYVGKDWRGKGGVTVGYQYAIADDLFDELSTNGYYFSSWFKPHYRLTIRAGYGTEVTDVKTGMTLTGDRDFTKYNISAAYKFRYGTWRAKFENKKTENDNIGSTAEFNRVGTDITCLIEKYGELQAAYDYLDGEYENVDGSFNFTDHVIWGNFLSRRYKDFQAGFGGTYFRSKQDIDIESFSIRFSGNYIYQKVYKFELIYTAHNFDDFNDLNSSPVYTRYYTANVIQITLSREF